MEDIASEIGQDGYVPDALWEKLNITPAELKKVRIIESSVYLTRKCNLKCQYCKIIKTELPEELTTEQWLEVFTLLEKLGVRFVNIAGGEPTILGGLGKMIEHLNSNTSLVYSIVSNSMFNDRRLKEMVDAGLRAYVASIDVMGGEDRGLHDLKKSSAGMRMLEKLREMDVPYLCANVVISGTNLDNVTEVVRHLSTNGVWVNVCPVVWGKGDKWDTIEKEDESYRLLPEHSAKLEQITRELLELKKGGARIIPTETYIEGIPRYGVDLSWKCYSETEKTAPPRLTVDADGALMTCINMRGEVSKSFNIFDLADSNIYERFMIDWWKDVKNCDGCYWSTMVMAKERQDLLEALKRRC